jgi:hypothetical protein
MHESKKMRRTLKKKFKTKLFWLILLLAFGLTALLYFLATTTTQPGQEHPVTVVQVKNDGSDTWLLPKNVLLKNNTDAKPVLFHVDHLRAHQIPVEIVGHSENGIQVKKSALPAGALVIVGSQDIHDNEAVAPVAGVEEQAVIQQVLNSGAAAIERRDFQECLRFVSPRYQDPRGYNLRLIELFLKRAFQEFSQLRVEFGGTPEIRVSANQAMVQTAVRLRAAYLGHSNYLLGDSRSFNSLILTLEKEKSGWKIVQVQGLRPLGFDERFLKLIGYEIGLPLNPAEQQERQKACMPCRERMGERFNTRS